MSYILKINGETVPYTSATWSGTSSQCSRSLTFNLPNNPYNADFNQTTVQLGDVVKFYADKKLIYVGTVTTRERKGEVGEMSVTSYDFMRHLLNSSATYKFKKTTPEAIARKIIKSVGGKAGSILKTNHHIAKLTVEDQTLYDIIAKAYKKSGKSYFIHMDGSKVSVTTKGSFSGVTLLAESNVTSASYSDTVDDVVDRVYIYNDKGKKIGEVKNKSNISKYGVYQATYTKEKGISASKEAKKMLVGVKKEASIEALGDIAAIAGYKVKIKDTASGLVGNYYVTDDSHTFQDGIHTMSLTLKVVKIEE